MSEAQQLLDGVLKLSDKERAWLATELLGSLDEDEPAAAVDQAWADEVDRRLSDPNRTTIDAFEAKIRTIQTESVT